MQLKQLCLALLFTATTALHAQVYETQPEGFSTNIDIVTCFIQVENYMLFLHRAPTKLQKAHPNTWAIPGGKVEAGESFTDAIMREVQEEVGLSILPENLSHLKTVYITDLYGTSFRYHMYHTLLPSSPTIKLNLRESDDYRWWTRSESNDHAEELMPDEMECIDLVYTKEQY